MLNFLTSKTGLIAAIAAVLSILVAVQTLTKPRREKRGSQPALTVTEPVISDLLRYARSREIRFEVVNTGAGSALLRTLKIQVTSQRPTESSRTTVTSAPVAVHQHRVEMIPGTDEYDIRARAFAPEQPPLTFGPKETEAFVVRLVSRHPHWYRARVVAEWSDLSRPDAGRTSKTAEFELDFPVEPSDARAVPRAAPDEEPRR